jgi:hypothetical protein
MLENLDKNDYTALSCRNPVNFEFNDLPTWPPFLLDLLPSGAGRRAILNQMNMPEGGQNQIGHFYSLAQVIPSVQASSTGAKHTINVLLTKLFKDLAEDESIVIHNVKSMQERKFTGKAYFLWEQ